MTRTAVASITPGSYFELLTEEEDMFDVWRRIEIIGDGKTMEVHPTLLDPWMSSKIRILKEYKKLDGQILAHDQRTGCLITGSAGLGKSAYLPYKFCLRLANRLPTVYMCGSSELFLFTSEGAYRVRNDTMNHKLFNDAQYKGIMALVDGDFQEPPRMLWYYSQLFMSSPGRYRYKRWEKERAPFKIVANAPSLLLREISVLYSIRYFTSNVDGWCLYNNGEFSQKLESEKEFFQEVWHQYSPNLQIGLRILIVGREALGYYRPSVAAAVEDLTS